MSGKLIQLDMFSREKELEQEEFKKNVVKSIRGLFARYNEIELTLLDIHKRLDMISESLLK